jgi:hypothetical protein
LVRKITPSSISAPRSNTLAFRSLGRSPSKGSQSSRSGECASTPDLQPTDRLRLAHSPRFLLSGKRMRDGIVVDAFVCSDSISGKRHFPLLMHYVVVRHAVLNTLRRSFICGGDGCGEVKHAACVGSHIIPH